MRLHPVPPTRRSNPGFSIIELMVTVGIIALIIGISFPFISAMTSGSRVEAGLNVGGMSADVARQWVQAESWANDGSTTAPTRESYSGTAALFCPTNEIRIVKNHRLAQSASNVYLEDNGFDGYIDLSQVDYIRIPEGAGIAGIYKDPTNGGAVTFIAPPFAIAFNELGQLNYGNNGVIYYNADGNNFYDLNDDRDAGYDPSAWSNNRDTAGDYRSDSSLTLPFEVIECVPGIVVYSQDDFDEALLSFDGGGSVTLTSTTGEWLIENGQTIFFSPHTGVALRDE